MRKTYKINQKLLIVVPLLLPFIFAYPTHVGIIDNFTACCQCITVNLYYFI